MTKSKKILIVVVAFLFAFLLCFFVLSVITMAMYSPTFLGRVLTHWDSSVNDYKLFDERAVRKGKDSYTYLKNIDNALNENIIEYSDGKKKYQKPLEAFIKDTNTTSFIVIKDDVIIYEQYDKGYDELSVNTSFSMAKSIVSLLVGKAIEDGYIKSVNEPIENYINEFKGLEIGKTTIEDLLSMRSKISYEEGGFLWFGDDTLTYFYDDLRKLALNHTKTTDKYNGRFHYNNYHPLLLGIILERSVGVSVSEYFEASIWQNIGAEHDASWSLDGKKSKFEKMESGINFRAVDFAKIGSMALRGGYWNGTQVITSDWLKQSMLSDDPINNEEYVGSFLENKNIGYKYMWYYIPTDNSNFDMFAWGKSDQILYISFENNTVILRTGINDGGVECWPYVLRDIAGRIG